MIRHIFTAETQGEPFPILPGDDERMKPFASMIGIPAVEGGRFMENRPLTDSP
jgi:hypothetical protein